MMHPVHEDEPHPEPLHPLDGSPTRLGAYLRWHRTRQHLSQEALADALVVSTKSIQRWERNQVLPQPYHREQLCRVLGFDPAAFFDG